MCFFYLAFSLIIDLTWILFWRGKWTNLLHDFENSIHLFVLFISWISILVKTIVVFSIGLIQWSNIKSSLPAKLQENLNKKIAGTYAPQQDDV